MKLRAVAALTAIYFVAVWFLMAQEHRYLGAVVVFVGALFASIQVVRSFEKWPTGLPSSVDGPATGASLEQTIETHSAEPETPERQRARFLGALGHELRNPLNSVTGFADILLSGADGELNAEQERSVVTIRASAERLLRLVATVVDQARLRAGTLRLQQHWVASSELVLEATNFVRARAEGKVIAEVAEGLPRVFVDRHRTIDALVSLAILVIRSSGTDVTIRVAPPRRDQIGKGFVQFDLMTHLEDSSAETLAIVERLERPSSRTDALGLEVSLARNIIEAQGGRIWTEAGTAGSLRVCITLPTSAASGR
jgi:K+-sensing histidine kinase KdpD